MMDGVIKEGGFNLGDGGWEMWFIIRYRRREVEENPVGGFMIVIGGGAIDQPSEGN